MPRYLEPMRATLATRAFRDEDWLFEVKWDGVRTIAYLRRRGSEREVELRSRNNLSQNRQFPEVVEALYRLDAETRDPQDREHVSYAFYRPESRGRWKPRFIRHAGMIPWRIEYQVNLDAGDAGNRADGILDPARHVAGHRAAGCRQGHIDLDLPVVIDIDFVNEPQFVNIDRDFRVIDGLQSRRDVVRQARDLIGQPSRAGANARTQTDSIILRHQERADDVETDPCSQTDPAGSG